MMIAWAMGKLCRQLQRLMRLCVRSPPWRRRQSFSPADCGGGCRLRRRAGCGPTLALLARLHCSHCRPQRRRRRAARRRRSQLTNQRVESRDDVSLDARIRREPTLANQPQRLLGRSQARRKASRFAAADRSCRCIVEPFRLVAKRAAQLLLSESIEMLLVVVVTMQRRRQALRQLPKRRAQRLGTTLPRDCLGAKRDALKRRRVGRRAAAAALEDGVDRVEMIAQRHRRSQLEEHHIG